MDDGDLVQETATEFVERFGAEAIRYLEQQAALAALIGDEVSEDAWLDIARVAARLIV